MRRRSTINWPNVAAYAVAAIIVALVLAALIGAAMYAVS